MCGEVSDSRYTSILVNRVLSVSTSHRFLGAIVMAQSGETSETRGRQDQPKAKKQKTTLVNKGEAHPDGFK